MTALAPWSTHNSQDVWGQHAAQDHVAHRPVWQPCAAHHTTHASSHVAPHRSAADPCAVRGCATGSQRGHARQRLFCGCRHRKRLQHHLGARHKKVQTMSWQAVRQWRCVMLPQQPRCYYRFCRFMMVSCQHNMLSMCPTASTWSCSQQQLPDAHLAGAAAAASRRATCAAQRRHVKPHVLHPGAAREHPAARPTALGCR